MTVNADDPTVGGGSADGSQTFTLDGHRRQRGADRGVVRQYDDRDRRERGTSSGGIKVADIVVTDDALGTETLTLSGADAASFEIVGNELLLQAGVVARLRGARRHTR